MVSAKDAPDALRPPHHDGVPATPNVRLAGGTPRMTGWVAIVGEMTSRTGHSGPWRYVSELHFHLRHALRLVKSDVPFRSSVIMGISPKTGDSRGADHWTVNAGHTASPVRRAFWMPGQNRLSRGLGFKPGGVTIKGASRFRTWLAGADRKGPRKVRGASSRFIRSAWLQSPTTGGGKTCGRPTSPSSGATSGAGNLDQERSTYLGARGLDPSLTVQRNFTRDMGREPVQEVHCGWLESLAAPTRRARLTGRLAPDRRDDPQGWWNRPHRSGFLPIDDAFRHLPGSDRLMTHHASRPKKLERLYLKETPGPLETDRRYGLAGYI